MPFSSDSDAAFDWDRIREETFVRQTEFHATVDSTNSVALEGCEAADLETPRLVLAGEQTAGRGRGANAWWSAPGALTFSLVIHPAHLGLTPQQWPMSSLTTGLAVCLALEETLSRDDVRLKWPNDVLVRGRKICGVLVEVGPRSTETLVIGIGVNINNSVRNAPDELRSTATAMIDETGIAVNRCEFLCRILRALELQITRLSSHDTSLAADWQSRCALIGRTVAIDTGSRRTTGVCQGIDEDGALAVLTESGPERLFGGVVTMINDEIPNDEGMTKHE